MQLSLINFKKSDKYILLETNEILLPSNLRNFFFQKCFNVLK